jgi:Domain of unknown function (DUF5625)
MDQLDEMKRRALQVLPVVAILLVSAVSVQLAFYWVYSPPAYERDLRAKYSDIPPLWIPTNLTKDVAVTFKAPIIHAQKYQLNLLVYYENEARRADAEDLIGRHYAPLNSAGEQLSLLPTTMRIVVQDQDGHTVSDQVFRSDGQMGVGRDYIERNLGLLSLKEGLFIIRVTPLSDVSRLKSFQTDLQFLSPPV